MANRTLIPGFLTGFVVLTVGSQTVSWELIRPSNTGIPGEEIRSVAIAPDGRVWVAARWPFWREGGVGILDPEADTWQVYSNAQTGSGPGPIPSEFINDIEFAQSGDVWIATSRGAMRFDGSEWTRFDSTNTPMAFDTIADIAVAPNGHVWLNNSDFNRGGDAIWEFDGTNWTAYRVGQEIPFEEPWEDLNYVFAASNGDIWVTNATLTGAARLHNGQWTLHGENIGSFDEVVEDTQGNIYFVPGLSQVTMGKWNGVSFSGIRVGFDVLTAATDRHGAVYYGNWAGEVWRSVNQGATWQRLLSGLNRVVHIAPDPVRDDIWIGTLGALGRFSRAGVWIKDYNSATTGQPDFFLDDLHCGARSGHFYVATAEYGVSRFDGLRWENRGSHNPNIIWPVLADGAVAVYEDQHGDVWLGTNGVARWTTEDELEVWDWRNTNWGVTTFVDFAEDQNGVLFAFGKHGIVYRFNRNQETWSREPIQLYAVTGIAGAASDRAGRIYFAGSFDVATWNGTSWNVLQLPYRDYLFDLGGAVTIAVGLDDTLWIGCPDGLVHYDGEDWTLYNASNTPMVVDAVRGIDFRSDGLMALALSDLGNTAHCGVAIVDGPLADPGSWHFYRYGQTPLPHYQIRNVEFDTDGGLWISAISEGIAVLRYPVRQGGRAQLVEIQMRTGSIRSGTVDSLRHSDDEYLTTRSGFGRTFTDLHHMELDVQAETTEQNPTSMDVLIESRIDYAAGDATVRLWNWTTGRYDLIGTYAIGQTEAVAKFEDLDPDKYLSTTGRIEARIRHRVVVPVFAFVFESRLDHVEFTIR